MRTKKCSRYYGDKYCFSGPTCPRCAEAKEREDLLKSREANQNVSDIVLEINGKKYKLTEV